ncbi:MAG: hypothetical protein JWM87_4732 [Candidatus Eremiobacteraeota bacterium]|nr:hypothetical protein [Candidatus Eremiobacteraeota bacterium]
MTPSAAPRYDGAVDVLRYRALRWIAAGLGVLLACLVVASAPARAATSSVDVGDQAVVTVIVRGKGNDVAVRVWDRSAVQVDLADDTVPVLDRRTVAFGTPRFPLAQQIPPQLFTTRDPSGQLNGGGALPPEEFPYASFRPGPHDVVRVDAPEGSHVVITLPSSTGILVLRVGGGQTTLEGYRGANLFLIQGQGRVQITGATTTAFVQMSYGTFYAADSTFDRIRLRGITAHDVFERCRSKQIEASSVTGSIVYDGGSFDPGLARFESQTGSIALGVTSAAQLAGRSQDGRVFTMFDRRGSASVDQHGESEAVATVGGGGPLVSAISGRGNVYLYEGSLLNRRAVSSEWRAVHQLFNLHRRGNAAAKAVEHPRRPGGLRARL